MRLGMRLLPCGIVLESPRNVFACDTHFMCLDPDLIDNIADVRDSIVILAVKSSVEISPTTVARSSRSSSPTLP